MLGISGILFPLQFSPICFMVQIYWFGCGLTILLIFIPLWASLGALSLLLVCGVCGLDVTILSSGISTTKRLLWLKQLLKHLSSPFSV
ncbi:hypothetical protein CFP56_007423 [Quercus suber]|uniref:Uncharacterized protein n=1 Tax=Quercus suber TaxID=58331 RepID=A0AAW0L7A6_QUESU